MPVLRNLLLTLFLGIALAACGAAPQPPVIVYTMDLRPLNRLDLGSPTNAAKLWDTLHAVGALQGLANRNAPQFYLFYCSEFGLDTDQFWFDWYRGEDGWLSKATITPLNSLQEAVTRFRSLVKGVVVYDPNVPATSNLASTAAGCDDLIPVRYDPVPGSVYDLLVNQMGLPVRLWLLKPDGSSKFTGHGFIPDSSEPSSGSAKVDCYRWALKNLLPRCGHGVVAYYIDSYWLKHARRADPTMHTLSNHDYFIARKAFFFDLSPWGDEKPNDDPGAPLGLERKAFLEVMEAVSKHADRRILRVGGFPPWPFKYTMQSEQPGGHDGVATEWEFGRLISQFNGFMEADAAGLSAMANASFSTFYPLPERLAQPNPKPGMDQWKKRGYVTEAGHVASRFYVGHYVGDYDSPAWLYKAVPVFFRDPARGKAPMGWAFDPNLSDRAPQAFAYAYRHATTNDFFIAGDSGAGYLNPRSLTVRPDSGLPSGLDAWVAHCTKYYNRFGMSITGFVIDGSGGASTEREFLAFQKFSPDGLGTHYERQSQLYADMATHPEEDIPEDVDKAAEVLANAARKNAGHPGFFWARSILKTPKWYADLSLRLSEKYPDLKVEVVDPYTFFGLVRLQKTAPAP